MSVPSRDTVREYLRQVGYTNVPDQLLDEFINDLKLGRLNDHGKEERDDVASQPQSIHITSASKPPTPSMYTHNKENVNNQMPSYSDQQSFETIRDQKHIHNTPSSFQRPQTVEPKRKVRITSPHAESEARYGPADVPSGLGAPRPHHPALLALLPLLRPNSIPPMLTLPIHTLPTPTARILIHQMHTPQTHIHLTTTLHTLNQLITTRTMLTRRNIVLRAIRRPHHYGREYATYAPPRYSSRATPGVIYSRPLTTPTMGVRPVRKCDPVSLFHKHQKQWKRDPYLSSRIDGGTMGRKGQVKVDIPYEPVWQPPRRDLSALRSHYVVPTEKRRDELRFNLRSKMV